MSTDTVKLNTSIDFGHGVVLTGTLEHLDEFRQLVLWTDEGPETISVQLGMYDLTAPEGHVYIKDWSEHSGLAARLQAQGHVTIVGSVTAGPFGSTAMVVKVLP